MNKLQKFQVSDVHTGYLIESESSCNLVDFVYLNLFGICFGLFCFVTGQVQGAAL
jgi:hypothetical protein